MTKLTAKHSKQPKQAKHVAESTAKTPGARRATRATRPADAGPAERGWLPPVASAAAEATGVPAELLGEYLSLLADAAIAGRRPLPAELAAVRRLGREAARQGIRADRAAHLYLSAAWRLWHDLPMQFRKRDSAATRAAAEAMLRVIDDAVAALVAGFQAERRQMVRHEESLRRQVIDDLLRGDADVSRLVQRVEPFGLDMAVPHRVLLAAPADDPADTLTGVDADVAAARLESTVVARFGDRDVLVAGKDGQVMVLVPQTTAHDGAGAVVRAGLDRQRRGRRWRVAMGRAYPGAYGIARSYEEAREALQLADRLRLDSMVIDAGELLVYRVLGRDQAAIIDLVGAVLGPLTRARGGAAPLLDTLRIYFETGQVATETARRLHLSVRAITYRLAKVTDLTGYDPTDPAQRFTLHVAVLGARLLDWPQRPLPADS